MANIHRWNSDGSVSVLYRTYLVAGGNERQIKYFRSWDTDNVRTDLTRLEKIGLRERKPVDLSKIDAMAPGDLPAWTLPPVPTRVAPTLQERIGALEDLGPFWARNPQIAGRDRQKDYFDVVRLRAEAFRDLPMSAVTRFHVAELISRMIACKACLRRYEQAGNCPTGPEAWRLCSSRGDGWNGPCVDASGNTTHWSSYRHSTIEGNLILLRVLFEDAMRAGKDPEPYGDPRCREMTSNPFDDFYIPDAPQKPTNADFKVALNRQQLTALEDKLIDHLKAVVPVASAGMMRRSEVFGLERSMVRFEQDIESDGATIRLTKFFVSGKLTTKGKNAHAKDPITLPPYAALALRDHLDAYRSTPNPSACAACAAGEGEHLSKREPNRHAGCDFADDAAVFVGASGKRPSAEQFARIFRNAVLDAGLDTVDYSPTPHCLRGSGMVNLLATGAPEAFVAKLGRWGSVKVMMAYYNKPSAEELRAATRKDDALGRAARGMTVPDADSDEEKLMILQARLAAAERRNRQLEADLAAKGGPVDPAPLRGSRGQGRHRVTSDDELRRIHGRVQTEDEALEAIGRAVSHPNRKALRKRFDRLGLEHLLTAAALRKALAA